MLSNQRRSTNSHIAGHVSNMGTNISPKCQTSNFTPFRRPWDSLHVEGPREAARDVDCGSADPGASPCS
ncbi:hypothetical protein E2C01_055474 [Portunus trituberculatus]|uniref:Uncharacterized protein n=1 Tax=Portunus trituberculatus TaxID=210409 RepID=A0A5B7GUU4_PORTR|nr:hypothetical protein [Portunus trituberculatus]